MSGFIDRTGMTYGRLLVLHVDRRSYPGSDGRTRWVCQCQCGSGRVVSVRGSGLTAGDAKSCGCLIREPKPMRRRKEIAWSETPEYASWHSAKHRCFNSRNRKYSDYGGRGITFFAGWVHDFHAFYAHVGPKPSPQHSLDRIDNDGNYEPGNVRWATKKEQSNNQRSSVRVNVYDELMTVEQAAAMFGVSRATVANNRNWWGTLHVKPAEMLRGHTSDF